MRTWRRADVGHIVKIETAMPGEGDMFLFEGRGEQLDTGDRNDDDREEESSERTEWKALANALSP